MSCFRRSGHILMHQTHAKLIIMYISASGMKLVLYTDSLNISRLSNTAKNKFFADLQTLPKFIRLYGSLNISRIKFLLMTPKTTKSVKIFPLEIFRLYTVDKATYS